MSIIDEFDFRRSPLQNLNFDEAPGRLAGFRQWLLSTQEAKRVIDALYAKVKTVGLFSEDARRQEMTVNAVTPEEIAAVGLDFITILAERRMSPSTLCRQYRIRPAFSTNNLQVMFDEVMKRYINPAIDFVRAELERDYDSAVTGDKVIVPTIQSPVEISVSLKAFREDYPLAQRCAFVMMRFGQTQMHNEIVAAIRRALSDRGITALRADDKEYHADLFSNVMTYMHGCSFGVAVFERLEVDDFNPNVSLEVGYMQALGKPICLLKDKTLKSLHVDLVAKLYRSFDPQHPGKTIPSEVQKWLSDKGLGFI